MERFFAFLVVLICVALLVRLLLKPHRRAELDARVVRGWWRTWHGARAWTLWVWHWRSRRRAAARAADDAIRRARLAAQDGDKVIRPDRFQRPRKPH